MQPTELNTTENRELIIRWNDGVEQTIPFRRLRKNCQCAACNQERIAPVKAPASSLTVLSAAEARPLMIDKMHPVGNYAYNIHFSDGHQAGIFTFEMLRRIGEMTE